jgi:hypothetical protein
MPPLTDMTASALIQNGPPYGGPNAQGASVSSTQTMHSDKPSFSLDG